MTLRGLLYQAAVRRSKAHFGTYAIDSAEAGPGAVGEVEWERVK